MNETTTNEESHARLVELDRRIESMKRGRRVTARPSILAHMGRSRAINTWSLIESYMEWYSVGHARKTIDGSMFWMNHFDKWLNGRGFIYKNQMANGIVFSEWVAHCFNTMKQTAAIAAVNSVSSFLEWLHGHGIILNQPHKVMPRSVPKAPKPMVPMSDQDYANLKAAASGTYWYWGVVAGWHIGASISDIALLKHSDVDWENLKIIVHRKKGVRYGAVQEVPIWPGTELHKMIAGMRSQPPDWNYPNDKASGVRYLNPEMALYAITTAASNKQQRLSTYFNRLCRKAGIDKRKTFHSFRCKFCTDALESGVSPIILMKMTGHKSADMLSRYAKPSDETLRKGYDKMLQGRDDRACESQL